MEEGRGRKKESLWSRAHSEDRPVPTVMATVKACRARGCSGVPSRTSLPS